MEKGVKQKGKERERKGGKVLPDNRRSSRRDNVGGVETAVD